MSTNARHQYRWYGICTLLILPFLCYAQSYGLRFNGHEEVLDQRTALDLFPDKPACFSSDFEIAFDLNFIPGFDRYYGYIVRFITTDNQNIDLIYDQDSKSFKLIIGDSYTEIDYAISDTILFKQWNRFKIRFELEKREILFIHDDRVLKTDCPFLNSNLCLKILFGSNSYKQFSTKDLPPMKIKDICINQRSDLIHHWQLNEIEGDTAYDAITEKSAHVVNPVWVGLDYFNWRLLHEGSYQGAISTAFDSVAGNFYVIGSDSVWTYAIADHQLVAQSFTKKSTDQLVGGHQSIFNRFNKQIISFYADDHQLSSLDLKTLSWSSTIKPPLATAFWHSNKFVSNIDTSLYIFFGYGNKVYKNEIHKYHIPTDTWSAVVPKGDFLSPRYLAAIGTDKTTSNAYIIGGFGSTSGEQMLNPKGIYDFLKYDIATETITSIYNLERPTNDYAFGNSLLIDEESGVFYGLIFPNQKYNSHLQLVRGSLTKPELKPVGDEIPFFFHDTESFADLYYHPSSEQFLAISSLVQNGRTQINVYRLKYPPNEPISAVYTNGSTGKTNDNQLVIILLLSVGVIVLLVIALKSKKRVAMDNAFPYPEKEAHYPLSAPAPHVVTVSSIYLFGNLQLFDSNGEDITASLTPILKEMFVLFLLYSARWDRGVSSEQLKEILWHDKTVKEAQNNRSVYFVKLKSILSKIGNGTIAKGGGYWKLTMDYNRNHVDAQALYSTLFNNTLTDFKKAENLIQITARGPFLANLDYPWLDDFKSELSNAIIDLYSNVSKSLSIKSHAEFIIQLSSHIFFYDPLHEDAMVLTCKCLSFLGKHTLAKDHYDKFVNEYKDIYKEAYTTSFKEIITY